MGVLAPGKEWTRPIDRVGATEQRSESMDAFVGEDKVSRRQRPVYRTVNGAILWDTKCLELRGSNRRLGRASIRTVREVLGAVLIDQCDGKSDCVVSGSLGGRDPLRRVGTDLPKYSDAPGCLNRRRRRTREREVNSLCHGSLLQSQSDKRILTTCAISN